MTRRTGLLLLLPLLWIACKKDSSEIAYTFKGVVLRYSNKAPIAGANVGITVLSDSSQTTYSASTGAFLTTTNNSGEYTITIKGLAGVKEYMTGAWARKMIQFRNTWRRTADQVPDTIWLDDASYVKMEIILKTTLNADQKLYLNWDYLKPTDAAVVNASFYKALQLPNSLNRPYPLVDSFAFNDRPRLFAQWILATGTLTKMSPGIDVPLTQDTNFVKIEF
jgi:hypothetical protein